MEIYCPRCKNILQRVEWGKTPNGDIIPGRAGDWFCDKCKSDKAISGYKYFWNDELGIKE